MGCASSTPMIQTTGSEMLKAASHVASDATKTAEEAVEGVKDSVGKTLETAKDSVATTVESVKHEVENVVKDKSEMLEDAKNTLMEKLHLKPTENESKDNNGTSNSDNSSNKDEEHVSKTEADELKTQLNENLKHSNVSAGPDDDVGINETNSILDESIEVAGREIKDNILTRTDTETDSLRTSTPEPEIEQAFAKSHDKSKDDDDKPPTAKSNLSELENLTAEVLKMQQHQDEAIAAKIVNDISKINNNDPLITEMLHDNIKTLHSSNIMSSIADNNATKDNEPIAAAATTTNSDIKSNNMHKTAQIPTAVPAKITETPTHSHRPTQTPPLLPLTLATTAIATATSAAPVQPKILKEPEYEQLQSTVKAAATTIPTTQESIHSTPVVFTQQHTVVEKVKKTKVHNKKDKVNPQIEEKRPRTTEWEKFADMLAQVRKFNPHDAIRRGGTSSKFSNGGIGQFRERPSYLGHGMDDDSSDTTSNLRGSPLNSQRSSARAGGRVQRLPSRPNTGNSRRNNQEFTGFNGGGRYNNKIRRNSNISSAAGRKFDFNPLRSRVHEYVSSTPFVTNSLQTTTVTTQIPYAPNSFPNESVKSPANMRSHHSRSDTRTLPPLESLETNRSRSQHESLIQNHQQYNYFNNHPSQQQYQQQQHFRNDYAPNGIVDHNAISSNNNNKSSSMLLKSDPYSHETPQLTRQSSNTSLFSNDSCVDNVQASKSSHQDVRLLTTNPPLKNTSSFLTTPRSSPFSIRKSYTDLYFSTTGSNKENKPQASSELCSRNKSPYKIRKRCDVCSKKYAKK